MRSRSITRRKFLKNTGAGAAGALGGGALLPSIAAKALAAPAVDYAMAPAVDRKLMFATLGDTLIPTDTGYPGYRHLETHGISEEVMKLLTGISDQDLSIFNSAALEFFDKPFVELDEAKRTEFLQRVVASFPAGTYGEGQITSGTASLESRMPREVLEKIQRVFRLVRTRVLTVFYQNFPEHTIARDAQQAPALAEGDLHQIINPNTSGLVTGWDVANFPGPLSWDEEEKRRVYWKKIHWHEEP